MAGRVRSRLGGRPIARGLLACAALSLAPAAWALPNGLALTPPMGFNSWTAVGCGVSDAFLRGIADFVVSSGLAAAGYHYINTDDCWSSAVRDDTGRLVPNPTTFPYGIANLTAYVHSKGLGFGIYSAGSSVMCSGHAGSLYGEAVDAATFAAWGVDYVKYDNCGEYALGLARFVAFADAVAVAGRPMVISTEPFSITPNPLHAGFANLWRTGNDISANYGTIVKRADLNEKWAPFTGPGAWADPDMLQVRRATCACQSAACGVVIAPSRGVGCACPSAP
jgi:alpha-galactosidase